MLIKFFNEILILVQRDSMNFIIPYKSSKFTIGNYRNHKQLYHVIR